jgi:hypothetical protein
MNKDREKSSTGSITALRVLRLLRVFQLAKFWKDFQELMGVLLSTLYDLSNIIVLLAIFLISFMLVGMEIFGYKLPPNTDDFTKYGTFHSDYKHQSKFNTFLDSFLSTFIILANDGWTRIYFEHYRATNGISSTFYFFLLIIGGQFILMNLFISVLIENFEQLSIRNDLVQRLSDLKRESLSDKIMSIIQCKKKEKDDKANYIDKLID